MQPKAVTKQMGNLLRESQARWKMVRRRAIECDQCCPHAFIRLYALVYPHVYVHTHARLLYAPFERNYAVVHADTPRTRTVAATCIEPSLSYLSLA